MTSSTALDATPSSQFDPSTGVMLHFVDEDDPLPSPVYEPPPSLVVSNKEPIVPEIPVTSDAAIPQAFACPIVDEPSSPPQDQTQDAGTGSGAALSSPASSEESSPQQGVGTFSGETPGLTHQASKETSPPPLARKSKRTHPHSSSGGIDTSPLELNRLNRQRLPPQ
nr:leukosialin-like [Malus domestica]XP_028956148.1 leukosialin-like [Malus domestica]